MELKGVIFDLDGVIVDTVPAHFAAWKRMFEEEGYAFDEQTYLSKVDGRRRQDGAAAVMAGATADRILAASSRKEEYFLEAINRGEYSVFPSTLAFMKVCREAGLQLATASSSRNVRYILQKCGIESQFSAIVGGDDVERGKPDPSIFLNAAERMGLSPANCAVIEDAVSGIEAAKAGGFYCVEIARKTPLPHPMSGDIQVSDLSGLDFQFLKDQFCCKRNGGQ